MQDPSEPIWFNQPEQTTTEVKKNISIMVCTPVHSEVSMHYTQALLEFQKICMLKGIIVSFTILKSSLVTQGRNMCVATFLNEQHKYTHMLFIDSDINFSPESIFEIFFLIPPPKTKIYDVSGECEALNSKAAEEGPESYAYFFLYFP